MRRTQKGKYYLAASVALITFIGYLSCLQNDFINWDDGPYVFQNPHIRSLNAAFFRWAFLDFYEMNWHPLTWVSHALDYAVWGLNPLGHHLTNIILHAINTFLVIMLVIRLLDAFKKRTSRSEQEPFLSERSILIAAGVTGLLFGLHPVHVESVAWIAERKDLLCGLFFLLSIVTYTSYAGIDASNKITPSRFFNKDYLITLGFFLFALLSKPMAVTLPLVLLILDWHPFGRIRSFRTLWSSCVEKLPFLALSLISSVLTVLAQGSGGAMELMGIIPFSTRLLVAVHSLIAYLWKMLWPLELIPYYPYPRDVSLLSLESLAAIALVLGLSAGCIVMVKKQKAWLAAWGYYVVTLLPVLGVVQVGAQSMADRYTYLPSLGPFLITGLITAWAWEKANALKKRRMIAKITGIAIALLLCVSLSYLCVKQIGVWKNDIDLWQSVIEKEHQKVLFAYFKRGQAFAMRGQYDKAIEDYNTVIDSNYEEYSKVYIERGFVYLKAGHVGPAISDLKKACALGDAFACKAVPYIMKNGS
jgi:hypothetical protein